MATSPTATSRIDPGATMTRDPSLDDAATRLRRTRARRTGWLVGGIAVAIYVAFILSGVIGR